MQLTLETNSNIAWFKAGHCCLVRGVCSSTSWERISLLIQCQQIQTKIENNCQKRAKENPKKTEFSINSQGQDSPWLHSTLRNIGIFKLWAPTCLNVSAQDEVTLGHFHFVWQHLTSYFMHSHTVGQQKLLAYRELRVTLICSPHGVLSSVLPGVSSMSKVHGP